MKKEWEKYWGKQKNSFFGRLASFYRKKVLANAVEYYTEKYFPKSGLFLECGSGSSQSSVKLRKHNRTYIAVDISGKALKEARKIPQISKVLVADIRKLPYKNESVEGIWNLGVMEHFTEKQIQQILNEFYRVLKKNRTAILFWPPVFGSSQIALGFVEWLMHLFTRKKFKFFPDEFTRLKSRSHAESIISRTNFRIRRIDFSFRDFFTHMVLVLEK